MTPGNALYQLFKSDYSRPDPGNTATIIVDRQWSFYPIVSEGVETRGLARPGKAGLFAALTLKTAGGTVTVTVAGGYNEDGDTSLTFDKAGDYVIFYSIEHGGSYYWRVVSYEGVNVAAEDLSVDQLTLGGTEITATGAEINTACDQSVQQLTMGDGFTSGTGGIAVSSIQKIGSIFKTDIFMDLTGLASSTTDLDIIGKGTDPAHFGRITAELNGTLFYGQVTCLETPAGGVDDIDFYSATEGTGKFDDGIAALAEVAMRTNGGAWSAAAATPIALTALPAAGKYMYAVAGAGGTAASYTAGQFLFELWGK